MDHKGRFKRLQNVFDRNHLDALLVTHLPNIRYLCGFTGTSGVLAILESSAVFFTDGRYTEQARAEVQGARVVIARKPPLAAAAEWLVENRSKVGRKKPRRLGIESEHLTVAARSQLASLLRPDFRLRETRGLVERARMVKDADEIALLRAAAVFGASLFDRALEVIRPGVTENEVAAEMEYAARQAGAEAMSFPDDHRRGKAIGRCRMGGHRGLRFRPGDSWFATSVLYFRATVPTGHARCTSAVPRARAGGCTKRCGRRKPPP